MSEPTKKDIEEVLSKAEDVVESGDNPCWSMTYHEGIRDALLWMLGHGDNPLAEE